MSRFTNTPIFKKTNVRRSVPDRRDHLVKVLRRGGARMPAAVNHKASLPYVFDQGPIGSCTANCAGSMHSWMTRRSSGELFVPSRLFLYYNTRELHGTTGFDSGATLRNTMRALKGSGVCGEATWPYLHENLFTKPTPESYVEGATRQALSYAAVPISLTGMKNVVASRPFVLGILVYSSFFHPNVARTGNVPVPDTRKEQLLGGHAILVLGYDDRRKAFYCRNSWGTGWGLRGDFYLPYAYATNRRLAFDAWVLHGVETPLTNARVIKRS